MKSSKWRYYFHFKKQSWLGICLNLVFYIIQGSVSVPRCLGHIPASVSLSASVSHCQRRHAHSCLDMQTLAWSSYDYSLHTQVPKFGTQLEASGTRLSKWRSMLPVLWPLQLLPVSWIPKQLSVLPPGHIAKYIPVWTHLPSVAKMPLDCSEPRLEVHLNVNDYFIG